MLVVVVGLAILALLLVGFVGYRAGVAAEREHTVLGGWQTGRAHVGQRVVSIETGEWTYGADGTVESWIDRRGTWHDQSWPACLHFPDVRDVRVRFVAAEVTVDDTSWRPILTIDCRSASPR